MKNQESKCKRHHRLYLEERKDKNNESDEYVTTLNDIDLDIVKEEDDIDIAKEKVDWFDEDKLSVELSLPWQDTSDISPALNHESKSPLIQEDEEREKSENE